MAYVKSNHDFYDNDNNTSLKNPIFYTKAIYIKGTQDYLINYLYLIYIYLNQNNDSGY